MKIKDLKNNMKVRDIWCLCNSVQGGIGTIKKILKTRVHIDFYGKKVTYDFPHVKFLEAVK